MKKNLLEQYRDKEREIGKFIAGELLDENHTILNPKALYPEFQLTEPFGIHRPGVNIAVLIFFYKQVVAYVPPIKREQFKHRFGINYETFVRLAYPENDSSQFIFPILNHPQRYSRLDVRKELTEILLRMPPTWERWHSALYHTGGDYWFNESDRRFNYPQLWKIEDLRKYWKAKLGTNSESFLSKEIKQQIRNNYTDLCLIGQQVRANEIAKLSEVEPELALNDLFYSSDLYAYPFVMGAGGTANIRTTQSPLILKSHPLESVKQILPSAEYFDTEVLQALLNGLRFDSIPSEFRIDFLLSWHKSENAKRARAAYNSLLECAKNKSPSLENLHSTMKAIIIELNDFCRNAEPTTEASFKIAQAKQNLISSIATVGGIATSIAGLFMLDVLMAIGGLGFSWIGIKEWSNRERVVEGLLKRHAPNVSPQLYWDYKGLRDFKEDFFRRIEASQKVIDDEPHPSSSSIPVRTIWWSD